MGTLAGQASRLARVTGDRRLRRVQGARGSTGMHCRRRGQGTSEAALHARLLHGRAALI